MTGLIREDPPGKPRRRRASGLQANLLELMETPNAWGRVSDYSTQASAAQTTYRLRNGTRTRAPGRWEFNYGPMGNGRYGLWARYLGPDTGTDTDNDNDSEGAT